MKIIIPKDTVALAIDYVGDAQQITAVRYQPEQNKIVPQFQLNTNQRSKDFGQWRQVGLFQMATNAQVFIAAKTKKAKRLWAVTSDRRFVDLWDKSHGVVQAADVVLEEVKSNESSSA